MMKFAIFLLVLVAGTVVNSDEEGNFLTADKEGQGDDIMTSDDGDYLAVTRNVMASDIDTFSAMEIGLSTRLTKTLNVGTLCATCRLLFSTQSRLTGIAGQVRVQDIRYSGPSGVSILRIRATPRSGSLSANPQIVAGGIHSNTATVRLTSGVGQGFDYLVEFIGVGP